MTAPGAPAAAGNEKTTLWGVLGIVLGLICCWVFGVVFGVLSLLEAKKSGKPPTLAYLAFAAAVINIVGGFLIYFAV